MRRATLPMLLFAMILTAVGCDYFRPADPEEPAPGILFLPNYRSPDSTLETVALAVADKGRTIGHGAYSSAFADSLVDGREFHAFFDPLTISRASQDGITIPDDWNWKREETFYSKLVTLSPAAYTFEWEKDPSPGDDEYGTETAKLHRKYTVDAIQSNGSRQKLARGFATLHLVKVADKWVIVVWEDREDPNATILDGEESMGQRRLES